MQRQRAEFVVSVHAPHHFPFLYAAVEVKNTKRVAVLVEPLACLTDEEFIVKRPPLE